jgi:predicted phage terminase large subunit-like protein
MKITPAILGRGDETEALAEIDSKSLRCFIEDAWPTAVPSLFQYNWHIGAIAEHLTALYRGQIRDLLINIPPRFGKSSICSVMFPAWVWLQDPRVKLLYSSYAANLAIRDSLATRQLIESNWYQSRWSDRFTIAKDQNEKSRFENSFKGYRLATSVGGANTGEGVDIIVCDDPHSVQTVESDIVREGAVRWWNEVMSTRGNDPRTVRRLVIAQRAHFADLSGNILLQGDYVHLNLPMEFEKGATYVSVPSGVQFAPETTDPRSEDGELLWKERYTAEETAKLKKRLGSHASAAQLQQRPTPREGGMFKRAQIQFYDLPPSILLEKKFDDQCWSWDCAFKDLDDSDYVVGTAWLRFGADFYLLHLVRDRMAFSATKKAIQACAAKYQGKITRILVEDKANGPAVIDDLKHKVPGFKPVEPEGGKEARAQAIEPFWEAGNIYLPMRAPWVEDFIQECTEFPRGAYDDQVDSMTQALVWFMKRMNVRSEASVTSVTKSTLPWHREQVWRDPRGE